GIRGRENRRRQIKRVAYDKRDRHGFTQRAAQSEHDAANDTAFRIRQDNFPNHFPRSAAQSVGRLFKHRRHKLEDVPHYRRNERDNHDRQYQSRREYADTERRSGKNLAQYRYALEGIDNMRLYILLE